MGINNTNCLQCKSLFKRCERGWRRYSLKYCRLKPDKFNGEDGFICYDCYLKLMRVRNPPKVYVKMTAEEKRTARKRKRHPFLIKPRKKSKSKMIVFKTEVIKAINTSNYKRAITSIQQRRVGKEAFKTCLHNSVQREVKSFPKDSFLVNSPRENITKKFEWEKIVEEAESNMPLLVEALKSAMPREKKLGKGKMDMRLGFILSLIMYSRHPNIFKFIQGCISVQLHKRKCGESLRKFFTSLGVCQGYSGTLSAVKKVKEESAQQKQQKQEQPSSGSLIDLAEEVVTSCETILEQMSNTEPSVLKRSPRKKRASIRGSSTSRKDASPERDAPLEEESDEDIEDGDENAQDNDKDIEVSDWDMDDEA